MGLIFVGFNLIMNPVSLWRLEMLIGDNKLTKSILKARRTAEGSGGKL